MTAPDPMRTFPEPQGGDCQARSPPAADRSGCSALVQSGAHRIIETPSSVSGTRGQSHSSLMAFDFSPRSGPAERPGRGLADERHQYPDQRRYRTERRHQLAYDRRQQLRGADCRDRPHSDQHQSSPRQRRSGIWLSDMRSVQTSKNVRYWRKADIAGCRASTTQKASAQGLASISNAKSHNRSSSTGFIRMRTSRAWSAAGGTNISG